MQIQSGKLYENRVWKYLYPCIKGHGATLVNYLSSFVKLAIGIGDSSIRVKDNCLFILIQTSIKTGTITQRKDYRDNFIKFLDWVKYQNYYVKDYIYENKDEAETHMVVLKIPEEYTESFNMFVEGSYSKMFTEKQINYLFPLVEDNNNPSLMKRNERISSARSVFSKKPHRLEEFKNIVNKEFHRAETVREDYKDAEYEFPISYNLDQEIFK